MPLYLALLLPSALLACGPSAPPEAATSPVDSAVAIQALIERGLGPPVRVVGQSPEWTLSERMVHHRVPAVSVAVFEDYEIVWLGAYGVRQAGGEAIDTRTRFQAASISKPVNAAGALALVTEGTWALDTPINAMITGWEIPEHEWSQTSPVTVHGFGGYPEGAPLPDVHQILDGISPANSPPVRVDKAPGDSYRYRT